MCVSLWTYEKGFSKRPWNPSSILATRQAEEEIKNPSAFRRNPTTHHRTNERIDPSTDRRKSFQRNFGNILVVWSCPSIHPPTHSLTTINHHISSVLFRAIQKIFRHQPVTTLSMCVLLPSPSDHLDHYQPEEPIYCNFALASNCSPSRRCARILSLAHRRTYTHIQKVYARVCVCVCDITCPSF